jgi:RNA recognition motif-containing protein
MDETRLFVCNLSQPTLEKDLEDYFSQAGVVSSASLMLDKSTGQSSGVAFAEFANQAEAARAVGMFHGKEFQGRALTLNFTRPREDRPPCPRGRE